jgi:hypothetical protein
MENLKLELFQHGLSFAQISLIAAAVGLIYGVQRSFRTSPLAMIRGPPSPSFIVGHWTTLTKDKNGNQFMMAITEKYGNVVKLASFLGVSDLAVDITCFGLIMIDLGRLLIE